MNIDLHRQYDDHQNHHHHHHKNCSAAEWTLNSEWWTLIWGKSRRGQRWVVTECPTKYISIIIIMKRIIKKIIMIIIKVDSTANDGLRMSTSVQVTKLVHRNRKSPKSGRKLSRPSFPNYHHLLFRPQIILFANLPFCAAATISQLSDFFLIISSSPFESWLLWFAAPSFVPSSPHVF